MDDDGEHRMKRMPDEDALRMFVGQIPRDWSENDCRKLLEPFGEIYSLNVLKEKFTGKSEGNAKVIVSVRFGSKLFFFASKFSSPITCECV